jgi:hypothetical protein
MQCRDNENENIDDIIRDESLFKSFISKHDNDRFEIV